MRLVSLLFALPLVAAPARIQVHENLVTITNDTGGARIEFATSASFRFTRWWGVNPPLHEPLGFERIDFRAAERTATVAIDTRYLTVEVDKIDFRLRVVSTTRKLIYSEPNGVAREGTGVRFEANLHEQERLHGWGEGLPDRLNLRGARLSTTRPFYFSSFGFGRWFGGGTWEMDATGLARVVIRGPRAEAFFHYGPSPKEIFEQHAAATRSQVQLPNSAIPVAKPNQLHRAATRIALKPEEWCQAPRRLNQLSLAGVIFPAFSADALAAQSTLLAMLPLLFAEKPSPDLDAARQSFTPFLLTYFQEAHDRGLPLIRPLLMQFPLDAGMDALDGEFMIGDEFLVAPGCEVKEIKLPRGQWTDLRTNQRHPGRRSIANTAPGLPVLVKNGSVLPVAVRRPGVQMELHYFPRNGGEFFLWEPETSSYSQFHAAPVGDLMRVETESKVPRIYEWIIHHVGKPVTVGETGRDYGEVKERGELRPGCWWFDAQLGNLHLVLSTPGSEDRIVNMTFPEKTE
jgi:hypothetical protein